MSSFPNSPKLQKGALIGLDPFNPLASVIIFQYNPDLMTRTLKARTSGGNADRREALRLTGPPEESLKFAVEIDATDQLETADGVATSMGIYPTLSSLEMLLYPKSVVVIANEVLKALGTVEIISPEAPLTILVWGIKRVLPVKLTGFTITEEAFDPSLNPIRARVDLDLSVLSYHDLGLTSVGGALFMGHQIVKEVMATVGGVGAIGGAVSGSVSIG